MVGGPGTSMGSLLRSGLTAQWNPEAVIGDDALHRLRLTLRDDSLHLDIDGQPAFDFRDPFPPPYAGRSRLVLSCWRGAVEIREFVVRDLGVDPLVRSVRLGDQLFDTGLHEKAREFYTRRLREMASSDDAGELRYKTGMCLLEWQM